MTTTANAAQYTVTDLGAFGGTDSLAWSINASGQVCGYATTAGDVDVKAFLWNPTTPNSAAGVMYDLGTLGGSFSWGTGMNASGQVVGVSSTAEEEVEHATLWIPTTPNGAAGTLHDLGTLGGRLSQANAVNVSGQVTGVSDTAAEDVAHAFLWNPTMPGGATGTMHDIGSLGGSFAMGWDINASGRVTGDSDTTDDAASRAFLWQPTIANGTSGVMHDLGTLGGNDSGGSGLNHAGQVTGWSAITGDEVVHAFLWTPNSPGDVVGSMLDLGTLGGSDSYGYAVDSTGRVVGLSYVAPEVSNNSHAFLYSAGAGMVDLNTLIDPLSGWELLDADDVNDAGQITGQGLINDEYHAFLLTPIPTFPGDFNGDSTVNAADLTHWKSGYGATGVATHWQGNADDDHDVDGTDFLAWQRQLNVTSPANSAGSPVPEPATLWPFIVAAASIRTTRRRTSRVLVSG
jgi:probable HAF family extracellular repeat protein